MRSEITRSGSDSFLFASREIARIPLTGSKKCFFNFPIFHQHASKRRYKHGDVVLKVPLSKGATIWHKVSGIIIRVTQPSPGYYIYSLMPHDVTPPKSCKGDLRELYFKVGDLVVKVGAGSAETVYKVVDFEV